MVLDRARVTQAEDLNAVSDLADTLNAALALFEPRRVPGHVDVHLRAESLEIWPLAHRVSRANESDVAALDVASAGRSRTCPALTFISVGPANVAAVVGVTSWDARDKCCFLPQVRAAYQDLAAASRLDNAPSAWDRRAVR